MFLRNESERINVAVPYTGKTFVGFKQALAIKESAGLYDLVNAYGYMGKYQFGRSTLRNVGVHDFKIVFKQSIITREGF